MSLSDLGGMQGAAIKQMVTNSLTLKALKVINKTGKFGNNNNEDSDNFEDLSAVQKQMEESGNEETDFDPGAKDQDLNKRIFMNKYGVKIDLPSQYVLDAKIYPVDINYCIKVVKHSLPNPEQALRYYKSG